MKKTVSVNIGFCSFVVDEDAYQLLKSYLDDISLRLNKEEVDEVVLDIESRIAEIFRENISYANQVVTIQLVRRTMAIIGRAEDFGQRRTGEDNSQQHAYSRRNEPQVQRLYRSRSERILGGVCGGVAEYLKLDVTLIRVIAFIFTIAGGIGLWAYIIMWIIVPNQPNQSNHYNTKG